MSFVSGNLQLQCLSQEEWTSSLGVFPLDMATNEDRW